MFCQRGQLSFTWGNFFMWLITVYSQGTITMFELDTEQEAREALKNIPGYKILSEIIYFNDKRFALEAV